MKKPHLMVLVIIAAVFLTCAACAQEHQDGPGSIQKTCFIMKGNPVNPKIYADYNGYRIYFCCKDCLTVFNSNPEKYFNEMRNAKMPMEKIPQVKK
jgi:YHS domain-containing protein